MFEESPGAYPTLLGQALALLTNMRLGWKGVPETKILACFAHSEIKPVKSFITLYQAVKAGSCLGSPGTAVLAS
jgi:hypothetical protein